MIRLTGALAAALAACVLLLATPGGAGVDSDDLYSFDDFPRERPLVYPDWLKQSFLYLREDLQEALEAGKTGLIVYSLRTQLERPAADGQRIITWIKSWVGSFTVQQMHVMFTLGEQCAESFLEDWKSAN